MKIVSVQAKPDRLVFLDSRCKIRVPSNAPIITVLTPHLSRLINVHGDVFEVEDTEKPAPSIAPAAKPKKRTRKL